jgi:hypothetical protein
MTFYSIAMCFYSSAGVVEVPRRVLEGREIFSARARLAPKVIESLYRRVVKPVAAKESKGSHYKELFLTASDGSTLVSCKTRKRTLNTSAINPADAASVLFHCCVLWPWVKWEHAFFSPP